MNSLNLIHLYQENGLKLEQLCDNLNELGYRYKTPREDLPNRQYSDVAERS